MFDARIARREEVEIDLLDGFPEILDALASRSLGRRPFLRAAWYRAAAGDVLGRTVLARRGDGSPLAAVPTIEVGPSMLGARAVAGSYWPFRSILVSQDAAPGELAAAFADTRFKMALSPLWRIGPVYRDDPVTQAVLGAATQAGWTILSRPLGRTYLFDLAAATAGEAWPRKSTRRRLANYKRQLARSGDLNFRFVTGSGWDEAAFAALAAIEASSWVGTRTDGSGAKFLNAGQRDFWRRATRDPDIARALSATLLYVDEEPAAFTFDLRSGDTQFSIASSFDERFASCRPGKIVTYRQLEAAAAEGVRTVDLGAGDSGYKREMGAAAGSEIVDLLIVRSRHMARLLSRKWGGRLPLEGEPFLVVAEGRGVRGKLVPPFLAAGLLAAALAAAE